MTKVYGLIFVLENSTVQSDDRKKAIAFTGTKTNKLSLFAGSITTRRMILTRGLARARSHSRDQGVAGRENVRL